ncbi:MAG: hypothetical protein ACO3G4_09695 [Opitutaceae bacterium]
MPLWEYKVITSGKGGFARPDMMEKFLNDLGREDWEIISFHSHPDNFLAFTGLARRSTQRDWTLEDAAAAAAKVEADRLRAEFEAKFKAATSTAPAAAAPAEDAGASFLEEKAAPEDGFRKLVDTSRDDDPDAPEDEKADAWDQLAAEDELPTFFEAIRPHMRRNQRGAGMSVGLDYLAKKWDLPEEDIKAALVECGFVMPEDEDSPVVYLEYDGDLFWVNINRRGELWINTKEKPRPVFRSVKGTRVEVEAPRSEGAPAGETPAGENAAAAPAPDRTPVPLPEGLELLEKIRPQMRRNRRGPGASGSASFLSRAFRTNEAELKAAFGRLGLPLPVPGGETPAPIELGGLFWWLNLDSRGGLWINATDRREGETSAAAPAAGEAGTPPADAAPAAAPVDGAAPAPALAEPPLLTEPPLLSAVAAAAPVTTGTPAEAPAPAAGEAPVAGEAGVAPAASATPEAGAAPEGSAPRPRLSRGGRPRSRPRREG